MLKKKSCLSSMSESLFSEIFQAACLDECRKFESYGDEDGLLKQSTTNTFGIDEGRHPNRISTPNA